MPLLPEQVRSGLRSQKSDRDPGHRRDGDEAHHQRRQIGPDVRQRPVRVAAADGAGRIVADAERRREEADAHRSEGQTPGEE